MKVQLNSLLDWTLRSCGRLLELLGLAHREFLINLKGTFMHAGL
jgi:hypothetical protein